MTTKLHGHLRSSRPRRHWARCLAVVLLLLPQTLYPATIPVSGTCTLVDAIDAANNDDDSGGLCPPGGSDTDTLMLSGDVSLASVVVTYPAGSTDGATGLPVITTEITVEGGHFVIERAASAPPFRIFAVSQSGKLTLNEVTVRNGETGGGGVGPLSGEGGGLAVRNGTLILTNSTVSGNSARQGGGINCLAYPPESECYVSLIHSEVSGNYSSGAAGGIGLTGGRGATLVLEHSTVSYNTAGSDGGGIRVSNSGHILSVTNSTISGNYACFGGGIETYGVATITSSTLSGNRAYFPPGSSGGYGGAIYTAGTTTVTNSTLSGNSAYLGGGIFDRDDGITTLINSTLSGNSAAYGGGIFSYSYDTVLTNSIVVNSPSGGNCYYGIIDGGHNLDDDGTCPRVGPIVPGVHIETTLSDNGGPTQTHALLAGSPAIDEAGSLCGLATDQRGVPRDDGLCDSGSFEFSSLGGCCTDGPGTESECLITNQQDCETDGGLFLGAATDCSGVLSCTDLRVTMESMSATATPYGALVTWTTATELDTVGFRLLRETPGVREKALKVVALMIPASGTGLTGATYRFRDNTLRTGLAARYTIEEIDIFGKVTRHGPIVVERVAPTQATGSQRVVPTRLAEPDQCDSPVYL